MAGKGDININEIQPNLPDYWLLIPFEECLEKSGSFTKLKSKDVFQEGFFPVVDQGAKLISGFIDDKDLIYKGELPVIIFGDHTRNIKFIDFTFAVGADGTKILKPKPQIEIKFFYFYLKSLKVPSFGYSRHYKVLKAINVPIPPLPEQKRIVTQLDKLFGHLELLKELLAEVPKLVKDFRQSVLMQAVTGKLTEEWREEKDLEEWKDVKLKDICLSITDGDHQAPPKAAIGIPFLVISNIRDGKLNVESATRFVPLNYYTNLKDTRKATKGDVLYTVTGSFGIPVLVDRKVKFAFQRHIGIIRPNNEKIISNYLFYFLKSSIAYMQGIDVATGTAQKTIPLRGLRKYKLNLPPLSEQIEIVRQTKHLFRIADRIESQYETLQAKIKTLPQAILAKAFRGELVQQLPTDGDVRELLAEIERMKASLVKSKPKRKKRK